MSFFNKIWGQEKKSSSTDLEPKTADENIKILIAQLTQNLKTFPNEKGFDIAIGVPKGDEYKVIGQIAREPSDYPAQNPVQILRDLISAALKISDSDVTITPDVEVYFFSANVIRPTKR
ncbi:MAG: hypothetical protein QY312_02975 [Candidatus Dojkabacteria bacterium]|nr:MAG: hypothetical protein QY312_02975 [Candidatus Dojkabacteria bacterium]